MMNKTKRKRRLTKSIKRRSKTMEKERVNKNWLSIWIKAGYLKGDSV